jgi:hypothetical protein
LAKDDKIEYINRLGARYGPIGVVHGVELIQFKGKGNPRPSTSYTEIRHVSGVYYKESVKNHHSFPYIMNQSKEIGYKAGGSVGVFLIGDVNTGINVKF